jgi:hypothetical protein
MIFDNGVKKRLVDWLKQKEHLASTKPWVQTPVLASSTNGDGKTGLSTCRRLKLDLYLSPLTKINFKWIKSLNVWCQALKLLQENIEKSPEDTYIYLIINIVIILYIICIHTPNPRIASPLHIKQRNQEGSCTTTRLQCPDGLAHKELSGMRYSRRQPWARSA